MDYNTSRKKLALPEYGRLIQKMVDHVKSIEDREERTKAAKAIINVMGNMNPHLRDVPDFKHKLWVHLAIMSDFELDIDFPYTIPRPEVLKEKPKKLPYSNRRIKNMHYGRILEDLIEKASEFSDGEAKDILVKMVANQMKKSYVAYNRDAISDDVILNDLKIYSKGKLTLPENTKLAEVREVYNKNKKKGGGEYNGYISKDNSNKHF